MTCRGRDSASPGDARGGERLAVEPQRLAVDRRELRRPIADGGVELRAHRQIREDVVRPAAADDRRRVGVRHGPRVHALLDSFERRRAVQLQAVPRQAAARATDVCASSNPGSTAAPFASITVVCGRR
jgi:hypothetical protein